MALEITARHFDASDKLKNYVNRELEKLSKFFDRITDIRVVMEAIEGKQYKIELFCNVPGKNLKAEASDTEPTKAVDDVVTKMVRQVKKYKEGLKSR